MLVAAAVLPHPPLLVPEVAVGAAHETADLRSLCRQAVADLLATPADLLVVIGGGAGTSTISPDARASFADLGVPFEVPLLDLPSAEGFPVNGGAVDASLHDAPSAEPSGEEGDGAFPLSCAEPSGGAADEAFPLSLTVARWLLADHLRTEVPPAGVQLLWQQVDVDAPAPVCAALGALLAASAERVSFLVMADLSACRSLAAPGYLDPRSEPWDAHVVAALAAGDAASLIDLSSSTSRELRFAGRAALQLLAGAILGDGSGSTGPAGRLESAIRYDDAPYGVGYVVAQFEMPQGVTASGSR